MANSETPGLDDFLAYLTDSPTAIQAGVAAGLWASAQLIEAQAKANCPVEHGELRDSIRASIKEVGTKVLASVTAGGAAPGGVYIAYAHLVEFSGAAPHRIEAKSGRRLTFNGRSYKAVDHPGMKARPFLRPALDARTLDAIALVEQEVKSVLK
ncbi:HK97-gp10 family putative phage morphogenesis protein [Massilia genomosp. 1]|uniref:HK97 gp10 family phage protein n=1 Tax=Massilia genomosp. 1 TaxID=2609280 RepID=A0ABX0MIK9_9BURK|nr:HK97-gp10 family putative phage morphogenesis protein [Massilia genomosp. 1]NHZ62609.1 hypothetical protein [Massilia genomosp. 1]